MSSFTYLAIDLKSFYASVECIERGLDPLTTNLVVADKSRSSVLKRSPFRFCVSTFPISFQSLSLS